MKKIIKIYLGIFLGVCSLVGVSVAQAAEPVSVAECTMLESHWQSAKNQYLEQGFRPEYDTLSGIKLWLGGSGTISWEIVALEQNDDVIASGEIEYDAPGVYSRNFTPVTVYPGDHFSLDITSSTSSSWRTSSNASCYNITAALVNGAVPSDSAVKDFNFVIYGYNAPAAISADTGSQPASSTSDQGSSASSSSTASNQNSTINSGNSAADAVIDNLAPAIPVNLKMFKSDNGNINFTWDANLEEDLSGYVLSVINPDDDSVVDTIDIEKSNISYNFVFSQKPRLSQTGNYKYYLQAKDVTGNLSEKAQFQEEKSTVANMVLGRNNSLDAVLIISIIILICTLIATVYLSIRAKKSGSKINPKLFYLAACVGLLALTSIAWRIIA